MLGSRGPLQGHCMLNWRPGGSEGHLEVAQPVSALLCEAAQAPCEGLVLCSSSLGAGNIGGSLLSPCSHLVPFRSSTQEVPLALTGIGEWILLESRVMSQTM